MRWNLLLVGLVSLALSACAKRDADPAADSSAAAPSAMIRDSSVAVPEVPYRVPDTTAKSKVPPPVPTPPKKKN